ncbi:g11723 [Coccomyxa viridis]|uniref:Protein FAM33A n=1 Tax=Coccomyxa viridis TaxID=1274662 RepID=A0ABP1GCS4_9CHLO
MEDLSASADGVIISLRRADADLSAVMHRLDSEFQHRFPTEGNPLSIMKRLGGLQGQLPTIIRAYEELQRGKQEVWRATQEQVAANDELLKQLSARAGLPTDSHAPGNSLLEKMQELHSGAQN